MILLEQHPRGVLLTVRVHAGARRTGVAGKHDGALRIEVAAAPDKGKANRAVADVLAGLFDLTKSRVELVSGATTPKKRFLIVGLDASQAQQRLSRALPPGKSR
jgi:uncharacterized protein (TIGR00251 family)